MRIIGLTGGIASGKSTFAAALRALGTEVIDADALARAAVAPGTATLAAIAQTFGKEVLDTSGALDRKRLAALVFADSAARARLEGITHPAIRAAMAEESLRLAAGGRELAFYDVPLLFEVGLDRDLDCVVLVYAAPEVQMDRLMRRDGLGRSEAEARLAAQIPIDEKAARADVVVVNDGDLEALRRKAAAVLDDLRAGLSRRLPNAPPKRY